jgi:hypothetical protein
MDGTKQHWPGTNSISGHEQHRQEQTASLGTNSIGREHSITGTNSIGQA